MTVARAVRHCRSSMAGLRADAPVFTPQRDGGRGTAERVRRLGAADGPGRGVEDDGRLHGAPPRAGRRGRGPGSTTAAGAATVKGSAGLGRSGGAETTQGHGIRRPRYRRRVQPSRPDRAGFDWTSPSPSPSSTELTTEPSSGSESFGIRAAADATYFPQDTSFPSLGESSSHKDRHRRRRRHARRLTVSPARTWSDHIRSRMASWPSEGSDGEGNGGGGDDACPHAPTVPQNLQDLASSLGLTLLQQGRKSRETTPAGRDENERNRDGSKEAGDGRVDRGADEPRLRPRLVTTKMRDQLFEALKNRQACLKDFESRKQETRTEPDVALSDEEGCSHQWDLVPTLPLNEPGILLSLDPRYLDAERPLHLAIENNDEEAVQNLLRDNDRLALLVAPGCMSPIQLATARNRFNILRLLLKSKYIISLPDEADCLPPPHVAIKNASQECLQLLLSHIANYVLARDENGNNILHICCNRSVPVSTLQLVLYMVTNSPTLVSKAMLSTNNLKETPMHLACRHGLVAKVEILLSTLGFALLSKLFKIRNADEHTPFLVAVVSGATNVVMSLFMWRGNNHVQITSTTEMCPLVCAVKALNIEMSMLLLEFNDPCGRGYDLAGALKAAVDSAHDSIQEDEEEVILELARILVAAGANPYEVNGTTGKSVLTMAIEKGSHRLLAALIDNHDHHLEKIRSERRRDPVLQKQPESFFAAIESKERAERGRALRETMLISVFQMYGSTNASNQAFHCVLILSRRGARLDHWGLVQLKSNVAARGPQATSVLPVTLNCPFAYNLKHSTSLNSNNEMHWSMSMLRMPWMKSRVALEASSCTFVKSNYGRGSFPGPDVNIVSADGEIFPAHSAILSEKSEKFAAAIRFASISNDLEASLLEVRTEVSSELCLLFLQHIYHDSILTLQGCCDSALARVHSLLELIVVADEYICPTLMQECAMRLLSNDPCRCFCRSCTKQVYEPASSYQVSGESACITVDSCLDIVAFMQHLQSHGCSCSTSLVISWEEEALWGPVSGRHEMCVDSLDAIKEAVARFILTNFDRLLQDAQCDLVSADDESAERAHQLFLMCLDEYIGSPIGATGKQTSCHTESRFGLPAGKSIDIS